MASPFLVRTGGQIPIKRYTKKRMCRDVILLRHLRFSWSISEEFQGKLGEVRFAERFVSWVNSAVYLGLVDMFNLQCNLAFQSLECLQRILSISHCAGVDQEALSSPQPRILMGLGKALEEENRNQCIAGCWVQLLGGLSVNVVPWLPWYICPSFKSWIMEELPEGTRNR